MALFLVDPTTQGTSPGTAPDTVPVTAVDDGPVSEASKAQALLDVNDVAHLLNVAPQTVYKWVRTGFIPHFKLGKCVRFSQAAVLQWLAERESKGRTTRVPILEEMS